MASLNMSIEHGQTWEEARVNFEKGITAAGVRYGKYIRLVEWSDDRTSARLRGKGFDVQLRLDEHSIHADGEVPFFVRMLERPIRRFVEETLNGPTP